MAHIHTKPGQYDITVSMYIIRQQEGEWLCLVHKHKSLNALMQTGGHIETNETPWQAVEHELREETGYTLDELSVLQPLEKAAAVKNAVAHPVPFMANTHIAGAGPHFHSDLTYAFVASDLPKSSVGENESSDLRWLPFSDIKQGVNKELLEDTADVYRQVVEVFLPAYKLVSARSFSLDKPVESTLSFAENDLELRRFGDPVLRTVTESMAKEEILSDKVQELIVAMYKKLASDEYGVGLAAPQVGKSLRMSVIGIKPTPTRPNLQVFQTVIINPIYDGLGSEVGKWEGCKSCGDGVDTLYAMVPRFEKIHATWLDEKAMSHEEDLDGFVAHVFQHETDHLNGVLFVDRVTDPSSYMMADEYRQRIVGKTAS